MSLHEVSVNEAAAQLCHHMPSLLTRRDDLFPLARQVVKMAGIQNPGSSNGTALSSLAAGVAAPQSNSPALGYTPTMFAGGHPALLMQLRNSDGHNQSLPKRLRTQLAVEAQAAVSESADAVEQLDRVAIQVSHVGPSGAFSVRWEPLGLLLQSRLEKIKVELAEVIGKSDELRESVRSMKTIGDAALLTRLQKYSDVLSIQHNNLLQEQTGLLRGLHR